MNLISGMAVILFCQFAGETFAALFLIPVPGTVIGMILLAAGLGSGLIRLRWVEKTADTLTGNLAFLFVPAGVGITAHFELLRREWPAILFAAVFSTLCVLSFTGLFNQYLSRRRARK